jgi:hypothetical protein
MFVQLEIRIAIFFLRKHVREQNNSMSILVQIMTVADTDLVQPMNNSSEDTLFG